MTQFHNSAMEFFYCAVSSNHALKCKFKTFEFETEYGRALFGDSVDAVRKLSHNQQVRQRRHGKLKTRWKWELNEHVPHQ